MRRTSFHSRSLFSFASFCWFPFFERKPVSKSCHLAPQNESRWHACIVAQLLPASKSRRAIFLIFHAVETDSRNKGCFHRLITRHSTRSRPIFEILHFLSFRKPKADVVAGYLAVRPAQFLIPTSVGASKATPHALRTSRESRNAFRLASIASVTRQLATCSASLLTPLAFAPR